MAARHISLSFFNISLTCQVERRLTAMSPEGLVHLPVMLVAFSDIAIDIKLPIA